MRRILLSLLLILTVLPNNGSAREPVREIAVSPGANNNTYRGYYFDSSEIGERPDFNALAEAMRHQLDIVEGAGLSARVLNFFRMVPIVADEFACLDSKDPKLLFAACYSQRATGFKYPSRGYPVYDSRSRKWTTSDASHSTEDAQRGIVLIRPLPLGNLTLKPSPIMLHEFIHAYHANIMPKGYKNEAIIHHYYLAKNEKLYSTDAYLMLNEREFFAVTASVFLHGADGQVTRATLKQKQPDYFKYLVWLFGFDPTPAPSPAPAASEF